MPYVGSVWQSAHVCVQAVDGVDHGPVLPSGPTTLSAGRPVLQRHGGRATLYTDAAEARGEGELPYTQMQLRHGGGGATLCTDVWFCVDYSATNVRLH